MTISACTLAMKSETSKEDFANTYGNVEGLYCDITYHMGCTLQRAYTQKNGTIAYSTYVRNGVSGYTYDILDSGVTYKDTVKLSEAQDVYYVSENEFFTLNYYEMEWEENYYLNQDYGYTSSVNKAWFEYEVYDVSKDLEEEEPSKRAYNGFVAFPTVREEYRLGASSKENIDQDIYISRGTARSFDQHMKLLEVNSLEALEQYGNGTFNILEN
jgi:hypothetical protein